MGQCNKHDSNLLIERSHLERTIWSFISDNIRSTYDNELIWIQDLRRAIANSTNEIIYDCNRNNNIFFADNLEQAIEKLSLAH
ncbi:hypothetical protein [Desulforamulus aquiferis]|uniref:Uncharacterized protein n=1 Tax=Desulforamulus aquiferis TaxID=1397668 RepID=A0AAW7ZGX4_9FIRM|nr:hypothetical protein [Desulforamulus aquiferis]MDO7788286.1 hypothetical protein [Desulforamulus aquiferis]